MTTRREFVATGLAGLGAVSTPFGSRIAHSIESRADKGLAVHIDAHTHIFNAEDLAVRGFIERVGADDPVLRSIIRPLAMVLDKTLQTTARDAKRESKDIRKLLKLPPYKRWKRIAPGQFSAALEKHINLQFESKFVESMGAELLNLTAGLDDAEIAEFKAKRRDPAVIRFIQWAKRFGGRRYKNTYELVTSYSGTPQEYSAHRPGVDCFVAAMVDMDYWLKDESRSELNDQLEVFSLISRLYDGRILPFVAFDPLRDVIEKGEALKIVQRAILEFGFVGVKLYPPMGFMPSKNRQLDTSDGRHWPRHVNKWMPVEHLGRELDASLDRFYSWCETHGVPIMAHANESIGSRNCFEVRAHPFGWTDVLDRFPKLRVNLGHFGGWPGRWQDDSWTAIATAMMGRYENLYADLGHLEEVIKEPQVFEDGFNELLRRVPRVATQLMYGSDWVMVARTRNHRRMYDAYRQVLERCCRDNSDNILGGNAAKFLGLRTGEATRGRLDLFYDKHQVSAKWREILDRSRRRFELPTNNTPVLANPDYLKCDES